VVRGGGRARRTGTFDLLIESRLGNSVLLPDTPPRGSFNLRGGDSFAPDGRSSFTTFLRRLARTDIPFYRRDSDNLGTSPPKHRGIFVAGATPSIDSAWPCFSEKKTPRLFVYRSLDEELMAIYQQPSEGKRLPRSEIFKPPRLTCLGLRL